MAFINGCKLIGGGLATVSLLGSGIGVGFVFGCLIIGVAISDQNKDLFFNYAIIGFALSEAVGLFGLMMSFLILFTF